jgi:hypothetical protein
MPYEDELDSSLDIPTLTDMTGAALDFLKVKVKYETEVFSTDKSQTHSGKKSLIAKK